MNLILNYEGFEEDLFLREFEFEGVHYIFKFSNGYGASVIKHLASYGHELDLWELAVISFISEDDWHFCSDTPITNDVIGSLTDKEVRDLLNKIKEL